MRIERHCRTVSARRRRSYSSNARCQSRQLLSDVSGLPGKTHSCGEDRQLSPGHRRMTRGPRVRVISTWRPVNVRSQSRQKRLSSREDHLRNGSPARSASSFSSGVRFVALRLRAWGSRATALRPSSAAAADRRAAIVLRESVMAILSPSVMAMLLWTRSSAAWRAGRRRTR